MNQARALYKIILLINAHYYLFLDISSIYYHHQVIFQDE
jgi:hypothetical protein